jgi:S-formylglutathione hydrolase FrmB
MAFLQCDIKSDSLLMSTQFWALLPQDKPGKPPCRAVLYLLHGRSGNAQDWVRKSNITRYAEKYDIAVIMPEVNLSFYTDMRHGGDYFTYIAEELPDLCGRMFRLNQEPAQTYIAGLSMGGYGALKCAFNRPERYAGCGSFSAVTDIRWRITGTAKDDPGLRDLEAMFGASLEVPLQDDLFALTPGAAHASKRPRLMITCGTEDIRYEQNCRLSALLKEQGYAHEYLAWPGDHEWGFWDESVQKALEFFFGP